MTYIVLARKYRPQTFADVIGQEHVTRTLANAFELDRVHHAFLFTGARGVGKTTCARILAKALNCKQGMRADPCGECASCTEIASGQAVDVLEIDGASNTSVDNVRELREQARYVPASGRYKVYIIDEVHMLSDSAFNALLKTLEEPPDHVKFIFATTEPHKIPVTILSRCQRFDFRRVPAPVVAELLERLVSSEDVQVDPRGLMKIAHAAEGSVRDALSLLDQVISFAGSGVSEDAVMEVLGLTDRATLRDLGRSVLQRDPAATLRVVEEAFRYGRDLVQLAADVQHLLRDLAVAKLGKGEADDLLVMGAGEGQLLREIAADAGAEQLLRLYDVFSKSIEELQKATSPRLAVEMALLKLVYLEPVVPLESLVRRLEAIETGGPPPVASGSGGGGRRADPRKRGASSSASASSASSSASSSAPASSPAPASASAPASSPASSASAAPARAGRATPAVTPAPQRASALVEPGTPSDADIPPPMEPRPGDMAVVDLGGEPGCAGNALSDAPDPELGESEWRSLVEAVRERRPFLAATLEHGSVQEINRRRLVVGFTRGTEVGDQARIALAEAARRLLGPVVDVSFKRVESEVKPKDSLAEVDRRRAEVDRVERRERAKKHPRVQDVVQVFEVSDASAIKARVEE